MTLKPRVKILVGVLLSFMTMFVGVGYASVTGTLEIRGNTTFKEVEILYVRDASISSGKGEITYAYGATSGNPAGLMDATLDFSSSNTVSVFVTIKHNNTTATEGLVYKDHTLLGGTGSDSFASKIKITNMSPETSKESPLTLGGSMTFTVTYTYDASADPDGDKKIDISHSYNFVYASEAEAEKATVNGVLDAFDNAVNGDDITIDYDALAEAMQKEQSKKYGIVDYIGNVVGAGNEDTTFVESVFGDTLNSVAFGDEEPTKCTVMIKRLDTNGDGEYDRIVLYITPDTLNGTVTTREGWFGGETVSKESDGSVTVYAAVFDVNESGEWVHRGDIYKGVAETNTYYQPVNENYTRVNSLDNVTSGYTESSSWGTTTRVYKCDSVYTDSWRSVAGEYTEDGITYYITTGMEINAVIDRYNEATNK